MTYNDLCAEVCALGFEPEIESEDRLLFATRRAMNIIFTERPLYKTLTLSKPKMIPSLKIECIEHSGGVTDTVSASAKAYSFITCGSGSYTVTDSFEKRTYFFNANEKLHRGFLRGDGKIEFTGDYVLSLNYADIDSGKVKPDDIEKISELQRATRRYMILRALKTRAAATGDSVKIMYDAAHNTFYGAADDFIPPAGFTFDDGAPAF